MQIDVVRQIALSLPEASEAPHFNYASFRVRGKIFVTVPPEQTHIHVFVPDHARDAALTVHPEWVEKLHWGAKVVGLRAALANAEADVVETLIRQAWHAKAPKTLRTLLAEDRDQVA